MSVRSYQAAVASLREALDLLGAYRGPCGMCGHPDARHRVADTVAAEVAVDPAGAGPEVAAADHLPDWTDNAVEVAARVACAVLAADHRLHGLTRARAAEVDREVWADLIDAQ